MSIKTIADKAGMSPTAVSQILNKKKDYHYSKDSIERVVSIAREMNYQPNYLARSLRSGKRYCIGMAATNGLKTLGDVGIVRTYNGIGKVLDGKEYFITFLPLGPTDLTDVLLRIVKGQMVDGLIVNVYSSQYQVFFEQTIPQLEKENMPFVAIHFTGHHMPCHNVGFDIAKAGYLATQHLADKGYKKIEIVTLERMGGHDLHYGYQNALGDAGLEGREYWLKTNPGFGYNGYHIGQEMVKKGNLPDAFVVYSGSVASGMVKAFEEAGIRVPEDLGVVGCSDPFVEKDWASTITSIDRKQEERGQKAAEFLFEEMDKEEKNKGPFKTFIAEPELIIRQSSVKSAGN